MLTPPERTWWTRKSIGYWSRLLTDEEPTCNNIDLECCANVLGRTSSLQIPQRNPLPVMERPWRANLTLHLADATNELALWSPRWSKLELHVFNRAGSKHLAPDTLSRVSTIRDDCTPVDDALRTMLVFFAPRDYGKVCTRIFNTIYDHDDTIFNSIPPD